jgi:hypothetical protein
MSVLSVTSAALALARKAAGTPAASRGAEFEGQLADLLVHLSVLKAQCAMLMDENLTLKRNTAVEADEPVLVSAG